MLFANAGAAASDVITNVAAAAAIQLAILELCGSYYISSDCIIDVRYI